MGNQLEAGTGKIIITDTAGTVADLQVLANRIDENENFSVPTVADLNNVARKRLGMLRFVDDVDSVFIWLGSSDGWRYLYTVGGGVTRLRSTVDQAMSNVLNAEIAVSFTTDTASPQQGDWLSSAPNKVKFKRPGIYHYDFGVRASIANAYFNFYLNGVAQTPEVGATNYPRSSGILQVAAGDEFQIKGRPNPAADWVLYANFTQLDIYKVA